MAPPQHTFASFSMPSKPEPKPQMRASVFMKKAEKRPMPTWARRERKGWYHDASATTDSGTASTFSGPQALMHHSLPANPFTGDRPIAPLPRRAEGSRNGGRQSSPPIPKRVPRVLAREYAEARRDPGRMRFQITKTPEEATGGDKMQDVQHSSIKASSTNVNGKRPREVNGEDEESAVKRSPDWQKMYKRQCEMNGTTTLRLEDEEKLFKVCMNNKRQEKENKDMNQLLKNIAKQDAVSDAKRKEYMAKKRKEKDEEAAKKKKEWEKKNPVQAEKQRKQEGKERKEVTEKRRQEGEAREAMKSKKPQLRSTRNLSTFYRPGETHKTEEDRLEAQNIFPEPKQKSKKDWDDRGIRTEELFKKRKILRNVTNITPGSSAAASEPEAVAAKIGTTMPTQPGRSPSPSADGTSSSPKKRSAAEMDDAEESQSGPRKQDVTAAAMRDMVPDLPLPQLPTPDFMKKPLFLVHEHIGVAGLAANCLPEILLGKHRDTVLFGHLYDLLHAIDNDPEVLNVKEEDLGFDAPWYKFRTAFVKKHKTLLEPNMHKDDLARSKQFMTYLLDFIRKCCKQSEAEHDYGFKPMSSVGVVDRTFRACTRVDYRCAMCNTLSRAYNQDAWVIKPLLTNEITRDALERSFHGPRKASDWDCDKCKRKTKQKRTFQITVGPAWLRSAFETKAV